MDGGYTADIGSFCMASHVRPSSSCLLFGLLNHVFFLYLAGLLLSLFLVKWFSLRKSFWLGLSSRMSFPKTLRHSVSGGKGVSVDGKVGTWKGGAGGVQRVRVVAWPQGD